MKVTLLNPKRMLLEFPSLKEMNLSSFRITEFKEGPPSLMGRPFDVIAFLDDYLDEKGDLKYFGYWEGHNWSKSDLERWLTLGIPLSPREQAIVDAVKPLDPAGYIILMEEGDQETLRHELAHGLYFDNKDYKYQADQIVNSISPASLEIYKQHLRDMNYNDAVLMDEAQAYLVAFNAEEWSEICPNIHPDAFKVQINNLGILFDSFNKPTK
jgi:hypothetical protein